MGKATMRSMRAAILFPCLVVTCMACGPEEDDPASGPWPLSASVPGVVGYFALPMTLDEIAEGCHQALGWSPDGLSDRTPPAVFLLDQVAFGGPLAVALPLEDEAAFRLSLTQSPGVRHNSGDEWVFSLSLDHPALRAFGLARRLSSQQSLLAQFTALTPQAHVEWVVKVLCSGGRAWLVPSLEAGLATQRALKEVPGLELDRGPMVMSLDAERFHLAYVPEIQAVEKGLRELLLDNRMPGLGGLSIPLRRGSQGGVLSELSLNGQAMWALLEMISIEDMKGGQVITSGDELGELLFGRLEPTEFAQQSNTESTAHENVSVDVRLAWEEGGRVPQLLTSLRPVEDMLDGVSIGFDSDNFPEAFARWSRPLIELVMGQGRPADLLADQIVELLRPCAGKFFARWEEGGRALALTLRPGQSIDMDSASEIFDLFAHALDLDIGFDSLLPLDELMLSSGPFPPGIYWNADDVFYVTFGNCSLVALDRLAIHAEQAAACSPLTGLSPWLVMKIGETRLEMSADKNELLLALPLVGDRDW